VIAVACIAAAGITGSILISSPHSHVFAALKTDSPIGEAKGANPGRVVWVHDSNATNWGGLGDGHWWENNHTIQTVVDQMMSRSLRELSGMSSDFAAWDTLFRYFNATRGRGNVGYTSGEKVVIKTNFVGCNYAYGAVDTNTYTMVRYPDFLNTSPQVIRALLRQLVNVLGVAQSDISVGDPTCCYTNEYYDTCHAEFPNVQYIDHWGKFGRTKVEFSTVPVYWSCRPAGVTPDYVPTCFADATYLINCPVMKSHAGNGITLCAKNHYGSLIRNPGETGYYDMHTSLAVNDSQTGSYRAIVDLMGHSCLGGKTILYIVDGLYEQNHNLDTVPHKWSVAPFNGDWTSSLFTSQDPVAIECVLYDLFQLDDDTSQFPKMPGGQDYLIEAAQANNPPSGTFYDPNHETATERLQSLGAFEHWDNSVDRKYSRNLGTGNGIELVFIDGATNRIRSSGPPGSAQPVYTLHALPASAAVELFVPRGGELKLSIFDCRGRFLGNALDGYMASGSYRVDVAPSSGKYRSLPSGSYIVALYRKDNSAAYPIASCLIPMLKR
jgi:uncharacterized protein (DUF362 family)